MFLAGFALARAISDGRCPELGDMSSFLKFGELAAGVIEDVESGDLPFGTGVSFPDLWIEDAEGRRVEYPIRMICDTKIGPVEYRTTS